MSDREIFLMDQFSLLFHAKMFFQKQGKCVDFEIIKMNEISDELILIRLQKDCSMSEDTFFKVVNFYLWAYALMGIVGFAVIAYGLCLEFCHV
ncbi:hypothetical protein [Sulfuricurvum sp.]|uniref:hypothetical protein n=1 Tax=Sulfuricurvum sp. TaxID=2025608 RepID=UPI003561CFCB